MCWLGLQSEPWVRYPLASTSIYSDYQASNNMNHVAVIDNSSIPWKRDINRRSFTVDAIVDDLRYHIHGSDYSNKPYLAYQMDKKDTHLHQESFDTLMQAVTWCEQLAGRIKPKVFKDNIKMTAGDYEFDISQHDKSILVNFCKPYLSAYTASFDLTPSKARELAQSLIDFADILDIKGAQ